MNKQQNLLISKLITKHIDELETKMGDYVNIRGAIHPIKIWDNEISLCKSILKKLDNKDVVRNA